MVEAVDRVIAIGSPHGDDQAAWRLVERLQNRREVNARVIAVSNPLQLHDHVDGCRRLIVVDACAGSGSAGTVTRLEWPDVRIKQRHSHSTHGIGITDALLLAEKLGRLPRQVVLFGIELSQCQPGALPSDAVESALSELEEKILIELR